MVSVNDASLAPSSPVSRIEPRIVSVKRSPTASAVGRSIGSSVSESSKVQPRSRHRSSHDRSARPEIVSSGLTPRLTGTTEPSITYSDSYTSAPAPVNTRPR